MSKLLGWVGATVGGAIGWWAGARAGMMTAFALSVIPALVCIALILATHLACSQYRTRGSLIPAVTSMCG